MRDLIKSSIWLIPDFLTSILPISLSISIAVVYERLRMSNQLTAIFCSGINYRKIASPALKNAYLMAFCLLISNFFISPKLLHEFREYQNTVMTKINFKDKNSVVNYHGMSFFVREKKDNNEINGIIVCDNSKNNSYSIFANKGLFVNRDDSVNIELQDGTRTDFSSKVPTIFKFEKYNTDVKYKKHNTERKSYEKIIFELLDSDSVRDISEAHKKITSPFLIIIYAMIVFLFLMYFEANRRINYFGLMFSFLTIAVIQSLQVVIYNLTIKYHMFCVLFYLLDGTLMVFLYRFLNDEK